MINRMALLGLGALFLSACASTSRTDAPASPPSALMSVNGKSAAYQGALAMGNGELSFQGRRHRFKMTGVGAGGAGVVAFSATGQIYNLYRIQDFEGTYTGLSKGITLVNGNLKAKMTNERGVVIYLDGERQGLATTTGVRTFKVTLID